MAQYYSRIKHGIFLNLNKVAGRYISKSVANDLVTVD